MTIKRIGLGGVLFFFASVFAFNLFAAEVGYEKGFYIKTDDGLYKIKTNIQLMPQYQFVSIEDAAGGRDYVNTFQLRKARIIWSGNVFYKNLTYKFQLEAAGGKVTAAGENKALSSPNLRDAWINYQFSNAFGLKFGQFKPAHNREELTSSSKLQFVDRSINNEVFSFNRALGVQLHGKPLEGDLEYALFAVNDPKARNTTNANNEMVMGGRLVWNAMGRHGYKMSDIAWHEDPVLAFGIASALDFPMGAGDDPTVISATGDVAFKYVGWSFHGEGNYVRNHTADIDILGFLGQVGYFIIPEHFEMALRGAAVIPKGSVASNGYESGISLNYFFKGHNLKLQTDYNILWNSALVLNTTNGPENANELELPGFNQNQNDHRLRVQAQLYF